MFHRVKSEPQKNPSENPKETDTVNQNEEREDKKTFRSSIYGGSTPTETNEESKGESKAENASGSASSSTTASSQPQPTKEKATMSTQNFASRQDSSKAQNQDNPDIPAGPFVRNTKPKRAIGAGYAAGGYPGAAASYAPSSSRSPASSPSSNSERTLTIGAGITLSGEIEACDFLVVEGTVEAALKGASILDIAESGTFYGTVEIEDATIAGRFEGDIKANGRLTIKSTGTITGSIAYRELEVEAGAVIDGKMTPVSSLQSSQDGGRSERPRIAPAPKSSRSDDAELFSNEKEAATAG